MEGPEINGTYKVSEEQIKSYEENGFALLQSVLTPDEAKAYREIIDKTVDSLTSHDKRTLAEKTPYEREFLQCSHLWREFPEVKTLTLSKRLGNIAQQFLKADHVRLWHDQALYKVPGGSATEPHQDLAYWPMIEKNTSGTIWIALDEVTVDMGALYFIPGSHKSGIFSHDYIIENSIEGKSDLISKAKEVIKKEPATYNLKPGDATFHHGLTIHYTGANTTDKTRKGMTVIYFADGTRFDGNSSASDHHCAEGSVDGQPIATKWNPIIV